MSIVSTAVRLPSRRSDARGRSDTFLAAGASLARAILTVATASLPERPAGLPLPPRLRFPLIPAEVTAFRFFFTATAPARERTALRDARSGAT